MQDSRTRGGGIAVPVAAAVLGVVLVLIAEFLLDGLADESEVWHWFQHGLFFVGGVAVGTGGVLMWATGR